MAQVKFNKAPLKDTRSQSRESNGSSRTALFEQAFRNIDDVLRKEAGCTTELDYTEQTSWLLFLKYLDGFEQDRADEAALNGKKYSYILDQPYRWESWAAPKTLEGKLDHNTAMAGDDLRDFVNQKLFPYLHGFKERATGPRTIEHKIGEIFGEIKNKIQSGYNLREIVEHIDELRSPMSSGAIIVKLDSLREETQRLESIYLRKLAALDALRKSLLHQAFSGEL